MSGRIIRLTGYRITADGKIVPERRRVDVATKLRQRGSKRVKVKGGRG
jgi:hypothetical protein